MRRLCLMIGSAAFVFGASPAIARDRGTDFWVQGRYAEAVALWAEEAQRGNPDAQYNLGQAFRLGRGVPQSLERAIEYYRAAAKAGHKGAAEQLGLIYYDRPETRFAAIELLRALAAEGRPRAAYVIGLEYLDGQTLSKDPALARYYLKIAADGGVDLAIAALQRVPSPQKTGPGQAGAVADQLGTAAVGGHAASGTGAVGLGAVAPIAPRTAGSVDQWSVGELSQRWETEPRARDAVSSGWTGSEAPSSGPADAAIPSAEPGATVIASRPQAWAVGFGPYRNRLTAEAHWKRMSARGRFDGLVRYEADENGVRVLFGSFSEDEAVALCADLRRRRYQCSDVRALVTEAEARVDEAIRENGR